MVKICTMQKAIESGKIQKVTIKKLDSDQMFTAKTFDYNKRAKVFRFIDENGKLLTKFRKYNIKIISRIASDDDNEFSFYVSLKDGTEYIMQFIMKDNYSFFITDDYWIKNTEAVIQAIPKYLDPFKGRKIRIMQTDRHEAFNSWNFDNDNEDMIVANGFVIKNFDYIAEIRSGYAVITLIDNSDRDSYCEVLGATFIINDADDKENSVIIGACSETILTVIE